MVVLGIIGVVGFRMAAASGLERELAAMRARGLPTNPEEVDRWYAAVPKEENAALNILEAYDKHVEPKEGNGREKFFVERGASWRAVEGRYCGGGGRICGAEFGDAGVVACGCEVKREPVSGGSFGGDESSNGHLARVRRMGQLLKWEAVVKANRGDAEGARESLRSSLAVAESLKNEPIFISDLVRISCMTVHLQALEFR